MRVNVEGSGPRYTPFSKGDVGASSAMSPVNRTSKWWLITGGSSGLGLSIAMAVLQAGDKVIATGRNVKNAARQHPEFEQLGGIWLQLDVTSSDAEQIVSKAIHAAGGTIDVLINNAGMLHLTSIEDARYEPSDLDLTVFFLTSRQNG